MMACRIRWVVVLLAGPAMAAAPTAFEGRATLTPATPIDRLVLDRLGKLNIEPARLCPDAVFIRRVYLDLTGTIPDPKEVRDFLKDSAPDKRVRLVDRLLETEDYADFWAMRWSDLLRIKAEFPINLWPNGAQAYHRWLRSSIRENKPYHQFVREMLTASGSNFRVPPVNFYRAVQSREPQSLAQAVALAFMGERAEKWPKERLAGMAGFFTQISYKSTGEWKEEIVLFDLMKNGEQGPPQAVFPDGSPARLAPGQDPRQVFADWLIAPSNPWFARNIVNRTWAWLVGRGIIHEPDDIRPDNAPSNPELLAYLEKELVSSRYDLKHLYRLITSSGTYQLSSVSQSRGGARTVAEANFASYAIRRLEAEVLIDAICRITGTTEKYTSAIPEPFTFIPEGYRTVALPDGSISSPFLELFGRPPRDTGLESERNNRPSPAQRLHFLNSSHIQRKIQDGPKMRQLLGGKGSQRELATNIYLTIVSRYPTDAELGALEAYARSGVATEREVLVDLAWALVNSAEFQYRH